MLKPSQIKLIKEPGPWKVTSVSYLGEKYHIRVTDSILDLLITTPANQELHVGEFLSIECDYSKGIFYKNQQAIRPIKRVQGGVKDAC